ncbi:MAG: filamentous hemagglutinin N-terminal domain-containing protein [Candidatus Avigastranaerophilus sp.]
MRKLLSTTIIAVGILTATSVSPAFADVAAGALPQLGNGGAINADITTSGSNMNIAINGGQGSVGTINWGSFNVGKDASVNYEFTAHNQTALNKVDAAGGLSQIYGKITNSGCAGCGYEATGKIILLNPNGVFFGQGANVDVNSFTVSTMNGTFNKDKNQLELERTTSSPYGIIVEEGAVIHGDKNVTFATDNVTLYNGSKISTNVGPNVGEDSYGKVKIVTADGVNFAYYNNGAVKNVNGEVGSAEKMVIAADGATIDAGHIDIRNYSSNVDSQINLNGAALKATKAVSGNDGNIWLTASNKVVVDGSTLTTVNYADEAAANDGGDISIVAGDKVSIKNSKLNAVGNIEAISQNGDSVVDSSVLNAGKDIKITAGKIASAQNSSKLNANNITINGKTRAQAVNSALVANKEINVASEADVWFSDANLNASKITAKADKGSVTGSADVNNKQTNVYAGKDIDLTLANVAERNNGIVAEAEKNVTLKTNGTLSVSRIVSKNGDVTLESDAVIAGLPYTDEAQIPGDETNRSYIYVRNGKFTSKAAYEVKNSDTLIDNDTAQVRHHIEYGDNGEEKILLINPRPYTAPVEPEEPESNLTVDNDQTEMLNKIPRQPETYKYNSNVTDARTTFVDVFAAASQIEIEEDEEE